MLVRRPGLQYVIAEIDRHKSCRLIRKAVCDLGVQIHESIAKPYLLIIT